jgi:hypothetical protein
VGRALVLQQSEHHFLPAKRPQLKGRGKASSSSSGPQEHEDLPYRVELWNPERTAVEQVLAITANASIGYSAFYAAARDYFDRYITLRHKASIISRWNGPPH